MEQTSLFDDRRTTGPLADRMRPETLDDYAGQQHLLAEGKILRRMIDRDALVLHSSYIRHEGQAILFSAPSGTGKIPKGFGISADIFQIDFPLKTLDFDKFQLIACLRNKLCFHMIRRSGKQEFRIRHMLTDNAGNGERWVDVSARAAACK